MSGDTVVVGAFNEDTGGSTAGAAYVVVRVGASWSEQQKLLASDAAGNDFYGISVAIAGDTVVVGANYNDGGGGNAGAAYVVVRVGGSWSEQQKLLASDAAASDVYGHSVAISSNRIVVGAPGEYDSGAGAASPVLSTWSNPVGRAVPCARVRRRATLARRTRWARIPITARRHMQSDLQHGLPGQWRGHRVPPASELTGHGGQRRRSERQLRLQRGGS